MAAFGRLAAKRLHEDPKYIKGSLLALIGGLRAYVLKNVLYHFEITGFPPEQMGSEEAAEQLEKLQKDVSNPGSPGQVAPGRRAEERIPILDHLLSNPENWKIEDGEPAKPDYSVIFDKAQEEDSELFHIQQGSLRKYIRRHFGLEQKRFEVQKQLIGRYRTNLPDKPSSRQTPGLSGNGRDT